MSLLNSILDAQTATPAATARPVEPPTVVTPAIVEQHEPRQPSTVDVVRDAFPFSVNKHSLQGPNGQDTPFYGLFRDDTGELVGSAVSNRYMPHTTDDVMSLVEAASDAFGEELTAKCHFRDGHYVSLAPSNAHRQAIFGTKDNIFPRLIINAGYNGKSFRATVGFYRDLCRNLACIRAVNEASASIRHTRNLRNRIPELARVFRKLASSWPALVEHIRAMESQTTSVEQFIESVYPTPEQSTGRTATMHRNRLTKIVDRMNEERRIARPDSPQISLNAILNRTEEQHATVWELLNGVQGYAQHDMGRQGNPTADAREIMALNEPAVVRAEQVAVSLLN